MPGGRRSCAAASDLARRSATPPPGGNRATRRQAPRLRGETRRWWARTVAPARARTVLTPTLPEQRGLARHVRPADEQELALAVERHVVAHRAGFGKQRVAEPTGLEQRAALLDLREGILGMLVGRGSEEPRPRSRRRPRSSGRQPAPRPAASVPWRRPVAFPQEPERGERPEDQVVARIPELDQPGGRCAPMPGRPAVSSAARSSASRPVEVLPARGRPGGRTATPSRAPAVHARRAPARRGRGRTMRGEPRRSTRRQTTARPGATRTRPGAKRRSRQREHGAGGNGPAPGEHRER